VSGVEYDLLFHSIDTGRDRTEKVQYSRVSVNFVLLRVRSKIKCKILIEKNSIGAVRPTCT